MVKNYKNFSVSDFAEDDYFQSWVFRPDENTNDFWKFWVLNHPGKAADIEEAKEILNNFTLPHYTLSQDDISELWRKIQTNQTYSKTNTSKFSKHREWYWATAAVLVLGISALFLMPNSDQIKYHTQFGELRISIEYYS